MGKEQPRLEAEHPANATKNRYPHVLPCECRQQGHGRGQGAGVCRAPDAQFFPSADDHSRVRLTQLEGEPHSDYINANFIPVRATCRAVWGGSPLGRWALVQDTLPYPSSSSCPRRSPACVPPGQSSRCLLRAYCVPGTGLGLQEAGLATCILAFEGAHRVCVHTRALHECVTSTAQCDK